MIDYTKRFFFPGVIATDPETFFNKELPVSQQIKLPHPGDRYTLLVLFCADDKDLEVKDVVENFLFSQTTASVFERVRECNRVCKKIKSFSSWREAALYIRAFYRRIAPLASPLNSRSDLVSNAPALYRMVSIFLSWPFDVKSTAEEDSENYKDWCQESSKHLETLFRAFTPRHSRDLTREGRHYERECRKRAETEFSQNR